MRYEVSSSWLGDDEQVFFVWDRQARRIASALFRGNYRAATEECCRLNSKEGNGNAS